MTHSKIAPLLIGAIVAVTPLALYADHSTPASSHTDIPTMMAAQTTDAHSECTIQRDLSEGSRNDDVRCLQQLLIKEGFLSTSATGYFGQVTKAAVVKWQTSKGVAATGYFGALSRAALASNSGSVTSSSSAYKALAESHKAMMEAFMSTSSHMSMDMPDNRKTIAVLLYDEFEPLDAVGPIEVLGQMQGYKVVTVAKEKGLITSALGMQVVADYSFDELKNPAIVVVPGGLFGTIEASKDPATLAWLREADKTSEYTTSVCTGSWILGAAGLINGRQASTHWTGADYLEDFGAQYTGKRYTVDGKYVTAAGVSAGMDMSFKLIAMIEGDDQAKIAQLGLEYDPQPPFDTGSPAKSDPYLVKIMREMMVDHLKAAAMMGSGEHSHTEGHAHTGLDVTSWPSKPSVSVIAHPDAMGGWNLEVKTENFRFAPEHVNGATVANEGHAHLYIDGRKIGRLYGSWTSLPLSLFYGKGAHEIRVTLNANDHSDLQSNGVVIAASTSVTTK